VKLRHKDLDQNIFKNVASSFLKQAPLRWKNKKDKAIDEVAV
jgi:hypothetical protein